MAATPYQTANSTFQSGNAANINAIPAPEDATSQYLLQTTTQVGNNGNLVDGEDTSAGTEANTYTNLVNGTAHEDASLASAAPAVQHLYGSANTASSEYNQIYDNGAASSEVAAYNDGSQRAAEPGQHDDR